MAGANNNALAQDGYWIQLASTAQTQAPQSNKDTTQNACNGPPPGMSQKCAQGTQSSQDLESHCTCKDLKLRLAHFTRCGVSPDREYMVRSAEAAKGCYTASCNGVVPGMSQKCTRIRSYRNLEAHCTCKELKLGLADLSRCGAPPTCLNMVRSAEAAKGCDTASSALAQEGFWMQLASTAQTQAPQNNKMAEHHVSGAVNIRGSSLKLAGSEATSGLVIAFAALAAVIMLASVLALRSRRTVAPSSVALG